MEPQRTLFEAFKTRRSVRTFTDGWTEQHQTLLERLIGEANSMQAPFNTNASVSIAEPGLARINNVTGEAGWLLVKTEMNLSAEEKARQLIDCSFRGQYIVWKLTQYDIGAVWIGGAYNQAKANQAAQGFEVGACIAYGIPGEDSRFVAKTIRWFAGSSSRKPVHELFYSTADNAPIKEENAGELLDFIKTLQGGPSAANIQSWRFVFDGNMIHLYGKGSFKDFDAGIALCTMKLYTLESYTQGEFRSVEQPPACPLGGSYIISFQYKE